jgi:hypothetical protein
MKEILLTAFKYSSKITIINLWHCLIRTLLEIFNKSLTWGNIWVYFIWYSFYLTGFYRYHGYSFF